MIPTLRQRPTASDSLRSLLSVLPYQASLGQKGKVEFNGGIIIILDFLNVNGYTESTKEFLYDRNCSSYKNKGVQRGSPFAAKEGAQAALQPPKGTMGSLAEVAMLLFLGI